MVRNPFKVGDQVDLKDPNLIGTYMIAGLGPPYTVSRVTHCEDQWVCIHPNKNGSYAWRASNFIPAGGPW